MNNNIVHIIIFFIMNINFFCLEFLVMYTVPRMSWAVLKDNRMDIVIHLTIEL